MTKTKPNTHNEAFEQLKEQTAALYQTMLKKPLKTSNIRPVEFQIQLSKINEVQRWIDGIG